MNRDNIRVTVSYENSLSAEELLQARAENRLRAWPSIRRGKTVYWVWAGEIMPCTFVRFCPGLSQSNAPTVMGQMRTQKERVFHNPKARRKSMREIRIEKGSIRYFYMEDIGSTLFLSKKSAEQSVGVQ